MKKIIWSLLFSSILYFFNSTLFSLSDSSLIYEHRFAQPGGFPQTNECHTLHGEYHVYQTPSGYLCWQNSKSLPAHALIRAVVYPENIETLDSTKNSGLVFRVININHSAAFTINPYTKYFEFGYWQDKNWITIKKDYFAAIQLDVNYLDIVLQDDQVMAFINGKKAMETILPRPYFNPDIRHISYSLADPNRNKKIASTSYFCGFYSAKGFHSHFANLEVFQIRTPFIYTAPAMNFKRPVLQIDPALKKPNYPNLGDEIRTHYFTSPKDSPFIEDISAHTENGVYSIWNKAGYTVWNSQLAEENILVETNVRLYGNQSWAGITLKQDKNHYYAFQVNPYTAQARISKYDFSQEKILYEAVVSHIQKGEAAANLLAFSVQGNQLSAYLNNQHFKTLSDKNPLKEDGFGLTTTGEGRADFDFIRIYTTQKSFWEKYSAWFKLFALIALIVLLIRFLKKRKKKAYREENKDNIIKELLANMKNKKRKIIYESDLIFNYQITRNEAQDILSELSRHYGGFFDYDKDGKMYVSFEANSIDGL